MKAILICISWVMILIENDNLDRNNDNLCILSTVVL